MEKGHDKVSHTHCRQSPVLHSFPEEGTSPIDNFFVEGVGGLRHREWSARVVLFPQLLEIILADSSQCNQIHTALDVALADLPCQSNATAFGNDRSPPPGSSFKHPSRPRVSSALTDRRDNLVVFGIKGSPSLHDTMDSEGVC